MKRNYFTIAGLMLMAGVVMAKEDPNLPKSNQGLNGSGNVFKTVEELCQPSKSQSDLNINNVRATILGGGDMWWDLNVARYEIPKGSNRHAMFAGALWLGGVDEGNQLKLAAMTYRQRGNDYWPGPLSTDGTASTNKEICDKYDRHWIITREEVELHKAWLDCLDDPDCNDSEVFPGYESQIPRVILEWPGNGIDGDLPYMLAPFIDRDQDGVYDPLVDYPAYDIRNEFDCRLKETDVLYGDQTIWWVYNDRGNVHSESQGSALGFEIRAQAFAFATNDEINNMTFYNYRILNKSTFRLADTYFSTWFDPDLGNYLDDIIGCDIPRGLGYVYNADATDEGPLGYGANPPAVGFDFFQGPFADYFDGLDNDRDGCVDAVRDRETGLCVPEDPATGVNERIIMSQFMYYNNTANAVSGNPANASEFYNYMRSRWRNGFPLVIESPSGPGNSSNGDGFIPDGSGTPTRYAYPGASFDTTGAFEPSSPLPNGGWWESPANLNDKRGLHSAGPFSLAPGALNFITTGIVWERDQNNSDLFASVEKIILADDKSQRLFDNCFQVLNGPDAPNVTIQELDQELILQLSYNANSNNYKFRYRETDPAIIAPPNANIDSLRELDYFDYVFEGFQVFQLANKDVSISDLYDPTQARLVAQVDINNKHEQLINWNIDPNLNQLVPQDMTLVSNNKGIFMSFRFTEDAFATGVRALINHRQYYYTVIAYGVNQFQVFQPTTSPDGQRLPYLAGRRNINTYAAIPHIVNSEQFGTAQRSNYGDGPEITRIEGLGNGSLELELNDETHRLVVENFKIDYPTYVGGKGPVNIKVVDPLAVPEGDFVLEFTSDNQKSNWSIKTLAGDIIVESDTTLEFFNEQIIPPLGLSVTIVQPDAPGGDNAGENSNGVITSEIVYDDNSKAWWRGVSDDDSYTPTNWILAGTNTASTAPPADWYPDFEGDEKRFFSTIIDGTWGPSSYLSGVARATPPDVLPFGLGPWPSEVGVRPAAADLRSVDVVITKDPSKWTRVPVFELSEDAALAEGGKKKLVLRNDTSYSLVNGQLVKDLALEPGWSYFPGYAISVETGERLNMAFGENSWLRAQNGDDMLWNPTDEATIVPGDLINGGYVFGGQHYIYVFAPQRRAGLSLIDNAYKGDDITENPMYNDLKTLETNGAGRTRVWGTCMWASIPLLRSGFEFDPYTELPTTTRFRIRVATQYGKRTVDGTNNGNPKFQFSTANIAVGLNDRNVAENALDIVRVVPNPYYGFSQYETSQLDNTVKITNLPPRCVISIYSTSGVLIRQIRKDNSDTWVPWDLKNQYNVPISSGVYIIHVDAGEIGETVVKWFGALRPVDLNAF